MKEISVKHLQELLTALVITMRLAKIVIVIVAIVTSVNLARWIHKCTENCIGPGLWGADILSSLALPELHPSKTIYGNIELISTKFLPQNLPQIAIAVKLRLGHLKIS